MLTVERLKELLSYEPDTGIFVWKASPDHGQPMAKAALRLVAGDCMTQGGFRFIKIDDRFYMAQVLVCVYMNGVWPEKLVIHKNGNKDDNRFENLDY
jgi:HNH endonuclease